MTPDQRADNFDKFKSMIGNTEAERRDYWIREAHARGQQVLELERENKRLRLKLANYEGRIV